MKEALVTGQRAPQKRVQQEGCCQLLTKYWLPNVTALVHSNDTFGIPWVFNLSIVVVYIQIRLIDLEMPSVVLHLARLAPDAFIFELQTTIPKGRPAGHTC